MSTKAGKPARTRRRGDPGPGLALAQTGEDDDTDYDYYDTPSGNIWRPGPEPGSVRRSTRAAGRPAPGPRSGGRRTTGWVAALVPFPDRPHVASPPRARIRIP
jgi:hypothetical protein